MGINSKEKIKMSPKTFYHSRRPQYFSDSKVIMKNELPREILTYELEKITANQKENEFEGLCRRLAERLICPNLIPQVGPTGGGDGKTDSETHAVSSDISDRWFIPKSGWENNQKWAFAISAKEKWKDKVKSDVKKIVDTKRGYTKIFFMTNQLISSKKKKDTQDELKAKYKIEITILDKEWILEKVYGNQLIEIVINSLNLTQSYSDKIEKIGPNDSLRKEELEEIEKNINDPKYYEIYDFQIVEDAIRSAILSRELEKPKDEIEGKFERAERFCKKVNLDKQWLKIYYQKAWTFFWWFEDYEMFIENYKLFKTYLKDTNQILDVENYMNLFNLLRVCSSKIDLRKYKINFKEEKESLLAINEKFENDEERPNAQITAKSFRLIIELTDCIIQKNGNLVPLLVKLKNVLVQSKEYIEFPFESTKTVIQEIGDNIFDLKEYEELLDTLVELSEKRNSQKSTGLIYFERGRQYFLNEKYNSCIQYFGKAIVKLSKEESINELYLIFRALGEAYKQIGLIWASYNSNATATYYSLKPFFEKQKLTQNAINCLKEMCYTELTIGRLPLLFSWYEAYFVLANQLNIRNEENINLLEDITLIDGCLGVRLLNSKWDQIKIQTVLPDVLEKSNLWMSRKALIYLLGYEDMIQKESNDDQFAKGENLNEFFTKWANQPFTKDMIYSTEFYDNEEINLKSNILGFELIINIKNDSDSILYAEMILSHVESFFATSLDKVHPKKDKINITLMLEKNDKSVSFKSNDNDKYDYEFIIDILKINKSNEKTNLFDELKLFIIDLFSKHLIINNSEKYFQNLFELEEVQERIAFIYNHPIIIKNILGKSPKFQLKNWTESSKLKKYDLKREEPIIFTNENVDSPTSEKINDLKLRHDNRKMISFINLDLWDKAKWEGVGFIFHPEMGLFIAICFKNIEIGKEIFKELIDKLGKTDTNDKLRFSIIRGTNKKNPHWYKVHLGTNLTKFDFKEKTYITAFSRFHEMNPYTDKNIKNCIDFYKKNKEYHLIPGKMSPDKKGIEPFFELGIKKKELNLSFAWELGKKDPDSVVIRQDDDPYIPDNVEDAPVNELIKKEVQK